MKKIIAFVLTALLCATAFAQEENKYYLASYFGIKSNGIIDNTTPASRRPLISSPKRVAAPSHSAWAATLPEPFI